MSSISSDGNILLSETNNRYAAHFRPFNVLFILHLSNEFIFLHLLMTLLLLLVFPLVQPFNDQTHFFSLMAIFQLFVSLHSFLVSMTTKWQKTETFQRRRCRLAGVRKTLIKQKRMKNSFRSIFSVKGWTARLD